jgi:hypothetical protein
MATVQDEMEDRAQQEKKVRKDAKDMGSVLGQQQEGGDREKRQQDRPRSQARPTARSRCVFRIHAGLRLSPNRTLPWGNPRALQERRVDNHR